MNMNYLVVVILFKGMQVAIGSPLGDHERDKDVCLEPADAGNCTKFVPRYFFNQPAGQCEVFFWGGCYGNFNRFEMEKDCLNACITWIRDVTKTLT